MMGPGLSFEVSYCRECGNYFYRMNRKHPVQSTASTSQLTKNHKRMQACCSKVERDAEDVPEESHSSEHPIERKSYTGEQNTDSIHRLNANATEETLVTNEHTRRRAHSDQSSDRRHSIEDYDAESLQSVIRQVMNIDLRDETDNGEADEDEEWNIINPSPGILDDGKTREDGRVRDGRMSGDGDHSEVFVNGSKTISPLRNESGQSDKTPTSGANELMKDHDKRKTRVAYVGVMMSNVVPPHICTNARRRAIRLSGRLLRAMGDNIDKAAHQVQNAH